MSIKTLKAINHDQQQVLLKAHATLARMFELNPTAEVIELLLEDLEYNDENYYGGVVNYRFLAGKEVLDEITINIAFVTAGRGASRFFDHYEYLDHSGHSIKYFKNHNILITTDLQYYDGDEDDEDSNDRYGEYTCIGKYHVLNGRIQDGFLNEPKLAAAATGPLAGKKFAFTGILTNVTRDEAVEKTEAKGGKVSKSMAKDTDYLVLGIRVGSKAARAAELGVTVLTEAEWLALVS